MIEHFLRQPNGQWLLTNSRSMDAIATIKSIDCTLPLADVYDKVELNETALRS